VQHAVAPALSQQVAALAIGDDRLGRLEERQHGLARAIGVDTQQAGAVRVVFADPQTALITEQEGWVTQAVDHHRVLAVFGQGADLAVGFLGIQQAAIAAAGQAFGFGEPGTQHVKLASAPVIAHQAAIALAVLNGIEVIALVPQPLHALAVEQPGHLAITRQADRREAPFLAEHPAAVDGDHAIRFGQVVDHHHPVALGGDLEDAAFAVVQFAADQQAAVGLRQQRGRFGHVAVQHLDVPAAGSLDGVETLPGKEAKRGREQAGSSGQGDAGAAFAQDVRHEKGSSNVIGILTKRCEKKVMAQCPYVQAHASKLQKGYKNN